MIGSAVLNEHTTSFFFFYRLLCVLSHETSSSLAWCSNHKPPENRVFGQWLTVDMIHCLSWVSTYAWRSEAWCHWTRLAAHRPWPVRNLFNVDHRRRGRLKPGGQMVGSVTSDGLTTVVLNHASIHSDAAVVSDAGLSNQTGCLDRGRTEEWELISEHSGNLSFNWIDIDRGRLERLSPGSLCFRNNVCCVWRARPVV